MKKRLTSLLLTLCMTATLFATLTLPVRAAGDGTAENPYLISTAAELLAFRNTVNAGNPDACAKLTADIDMARTSWTPISPTEATAYKGTFDGDFHTIKNLTINVNSTDNIGLFGFIGGGVVKNVALSSANIRNNYNMTETTTSTITLPEGYVYTQFRTSVGKSKSSRIGTVKYNAAGSAMSFSMGNLRNNATYLWNLLSDGSSTTLATSYTKSGAQSATGGIAGVLISGTINGCSFSNSTIWSNYARAGGLIGWMKGGELKKSYSSGSVTGTYAGGAVGVLDGGTVTDCYSTASCTKYTKTENIYKSTGTPTAQLVHTLQPNDVIKWTTSSGTKDYYLGGSLPLYFYSYTPNSISYTTETVHDGYEYGFACTVSGSATITNSYYYNASSNLAFSNNASRGTSTYILSAAPSGATSLSSSRFAEEASFNNWDFEENWVMSGDLGRPVLYNMAGEESVVIPSAIFPTGDDAIFNVAAESADTPLIDLAKYISLSNGASTDNRFDYYIYEGRQYASISDEDNDHLIVAANLAPGDYTVSISGLDLDEECEPFEFTLTLHAALVVPVPNPDIEPFPFSRSTLLAMVPLPEGWQWDNEMLAPRDDVTKYDVYYPYSADAQFYDISAVTAAAKANGATVSDVAEVKDDSGKVVGLKAKLTLPILDSAESLRPVQFIVTNGDTEAPLAGAYISTDYEDEFTRKGGHTTDSDGILWADLTSGMRDITATATGFETWEETVKIENTRIGTDVYIAMSPTRYPFTAPAVYEKDARGEVGEKLENAKVTITKVDGVKVPAWNGGNVSATIDAESEILLADGIYEVRNATYGYTTNDVTYLKIDRTAAEGQKEKYYKRFSGGLSETKDEKTLYAVAMSEPIYYVKVTKDSEEAADLNYTVTVTLRNIKATMGTFGLRWDSKLFRLRDGEDSVKLADGLSIFRTPEDYSGTPWSDAKDYYAFSWMTENDAVINAENSPATIATYEFELKSADYMDQITADTFGIKPWTDIEDVANYVKEVKKLGSDPRVWEFWREVDEDNDLNKLKTGRIDATKAVVNNIATGGFFQAAVNSDPDNETDPSMFYDVMARIDYNIKVESVLVFHTVDSVSGEDIPQARVRLFKNAALFGSDFTGTDGRTRFSVNPGTASVVPFTYDVSIEGYWPLPESGLSEDRPTAEARANTATGVLVELEQKIYHVPVIKPNGEQQTMELVGDADLGGEKNAYNGRDFHFRVKGAKGYRIKQYPTKADIYVNGTLIISDLEPDKNCLFTLDKSYLDHGANNVLRALTVSELQALQTDNDTKDDYADWSGASPDADGFRGYNIEIKFDQFDVEEIEYIVEGMTNGATKGTVLYDPTVLPEGTPAGNTAVNPIQTKNGATVTDYDATNPFVYNSSDEFDYIKVKTLRTEKSGETVTQNTNHQTGTFTFTAADGYTVQKVYINGIVIPTYDDLTSFTYSFGEVDMDSSIIVLFGNEDDPAEDTVMTLVVGDFGFADTLTPVDEKDIMLTRRVFLNPTEDLVFETHAMDGYELYNVEVEKDGAPRTSIKKKGKQETRGDGDDAKVYTKYTVSKPAGEERNITVYVTFKNILAEISPNLFVKSYVDIGKGEIIPTGILIYNMHDTVELNLKADVKNSWLVKSVKVSPYYDIDNAKEYEFETRKTEQTYKWDTLTEDMAFGAVFVERAYELEGFVDLDQGAGTAISTANILSGAKVTFVRIDGENGEEIAKEPVYYTTSSALRTSAPFSIELPAGWWNVYITKPGYLNYKITNFEMKVPAVANAETGEYAITKFGEKDASVKHVVPYIGSTTDGEYISLTDAANIKSGWRDNVNNTVRAMADVDNNGTVAIEDMNYVMFNFNKFFVTKTYEEFINGVSETEIYVKN